MLRKQFLNLLELPNVKKTGFKSAEIIPTLSFTLKETETNLSKPSTTKENTTQTFLKIKFLLDTKDIFLKIKQKLTNSS